MPDPYEDILSIATGQPSRRRAYDPDTALNLISKYESGDRNVPNYRFDPGHTAQGYFQITNTNWRSYGPRAGVDLKQHPSAMAAPREVQAAVAKLMYDERGFKDWAPFNPRLRQAVAGGEVAQQQDPYADVLAAAGVQQSQPAPTSAPRRPRPRPNSRPSSLYGNAFGKPADEQTKQAIAEAVAADEYRQQTPQVRRAIEEYERSRSQTSNLGELRRLDDPEAQRHLRIQRELVKEDPLGARLHPRLLQSETLRRATAEREDEARRQREAPRLAELTRRYRQSIRATATATTGISPLSPQWTQEVVAQAAAGLTQLGAAATRPFSTETADSINLHAQALQRAAEEEGIDRNRVSKAIQNVVAGTITSIPELAAMQAGIRAPVAFGAGGAARAYGRGERAEQVVRAGAHGAATGAIFEAPAALGITNPLARVGTVGAGTGALELATGQPLGSAIETGATNALMAGLGEVGRPRVRPAAPEILNVEGRSTIPGYEAETATRAQREGRVRPPMTPAEVEQIRQRQPPSVPATETPVIEPSPAPRLRVEEAITSRAQRADRITQLEGELAQWQRAGGKGRRAQQRIRQIQSEIDGLRQSLRAEDQAAASQLAQQQSAVVEATRYSPTPRFDEWVENQTGQRVAQVPETELTQLRERYRQEFAAAPPPPVLREMPPLEPAPPVHHSLRQPRRQRGEGKGQFKKGKPAPVDEEPIRPPLSQPAASPETAMPEVAPPASETASSPLAAEQVLRINHDLLTTPEFRQYLLTESVSGNAGEGRAAVNAVIDPRGRVIRFGNRQDFPRDLQDKLDSGEYQRASFLVRDVLTDSPVVDQVLLPKPGAPRNLPAEWSIDFEAGTSKGNVPPEFQEMLSRRTNRKLPERMPQTDLTPDERPQPSVTTPVTESTTSARRAQMTADRAELDLPELPAPARKAWQETLDQAKTKGTANAATLAEQVLRKPRPLNDVETGQLVLRAQEIKNQLSQLRQEIVNDPAPDKLAQSDALQEEFNRLTKATKASGSEKGRTLAAQKLTINQDYDLTSLIQRATEAKGRKLTPEETTRYEQMAQRIAELEKQVSAKSVTAATDIVQREIERVARQRKRAETKQKLDEEFAQLKAQFQQARSEAKKVQASGLAGLDPEGTITPLVARMAENRIKAGIQSAEALVSEIYEAVKAHGWSRDDVAHVIKTTINQSDDMLSRWDKRRQGQLIKQQQELNRRLEQRDFTKPPPRQPPIYNKETQRLQEQVQSLKNKFELEMQREQPGHRWRTLSGLRKSWMLSGLTTQAKNIGGTGGYQVFEELARLPAVIADAAAAPFTGQRTLTTSPAQMLDAVLHARKVGLREAGQIMRQGATPEQMERHQFSEIDTGVKVIDYASNLVFRFMSASDRVFYQYSYKRNLNDRAMAQAKNEGLGRERARELSENPSEELDAAAKHDAMVATFNNNNRLSDAIKSGRARLGPKANFAIDLIMPFDRTPTNVIARVLEASPVGLGQPAYRVAKALVNKSMTPAEQRQFSQTLGRATVGTAILALGWKLADDAFDIEDSGQVFLNIAGRRFNLNSISPVGNLLATGAKLKQDYKKGDVTGVAKDLARTPLDQPLLRAGSEVTELLRDPERSAARTGARLASSFIPFGGAARDLAKALDPEERRFPDPKSFTQQVQQNLPVLRQRLPITRSKVFQGQTASSPATKEIQRLDMRLQGAMPGDDEPPERYQQRRQVMNPAVVKELERLVQSPAYARLSDDDKKKQIHTLVQSVAAQFRPSTSRRPSRPSRRDLRP